MSSCCSIVLHAALLATGPVDGKALYSEHCASCHGKEGGGDGLLAKDLKYKPRAFKEGRFAFGNTPDAMVKTVQSGIPGEDQPRMPAFKSVLEEDEVKAVVDYVRTLMPPQPVLTPADMKMEVTDTAKIVRGYLQPLKEGDPVIPRGLLVGLPSGFTFEYATDDLRLLAVRRGDFVTRSDWEGRGGRGLAPLGTVIWTNEVGVTLPQFKFHWGTSKQDAQEAWLHARLRSTHVSGASAAISYDLLDDAGTQFASVVETPTEAVVNGGAGFTRTLVVDAKDRKGELYVQMFATLNGVDDARNVFASDSTGRSRAIYWGTRKLSDGRFACAFLPLDATHNEAEFATRPPNRPAASSSENPPDMWYGGRFDVDHAPVTIRLTTIVRSDLPDDILKTMTKELGR